MIAATWYRPDVLAARMPCVVMGHGFTLTRRDGVPEYARRLVAAGFVALAFDYRHWGDDPGSPRGWISLREQLADWQAAVQHAGTLEGVDADRIAVWGFSMGGGHALLTAARDTRIAAVVALMPSTDPLAALPPLTVGLRMIGRARREAITRRTVTMPAAGPPGSFAVIAAPEALQGFERLTSGRVWRNEVNTSWRLTGRRWRPVREAVNIRAPVLLQLGERDGAVRLRQSSGQRRAPRVPSSSDTTSTTSSASAPSTSTGSPPTKSTSSGVFWPAPPIRRGSPEHRANPVAQPTRQDNACAPCAGKPIHERTRRQQAASANP